tara:strand:+ start:593 stop:1165 length:573 start_codon:yes stop_codon:yes gene_type:complete
MIQKVFSHGAGRLDAAMLNDMNRAVAQTNSQPEAFGAPAWSGPYMAIINPPSGIPAQELQWRDDPDNLKPIKWGYDFVVVSPNQAVRTDINNDTTYLYKSNSLNYLSTGMEADAATALNLCELNNNSTSAMGVSYNNLPDGIELQPVPAETHVMLWLCPMEYVAGDTTTPGNQGWVAYFTYPNQFDGDCE